MFMVMFMLIFCTTVVPSIGSNVVNRIENRVIHFEEQSDRGFWLSSKIETLKFFNMILSKWLLMRPIPERDVYYRPETQFKATKCGEGLVCLEAVASPNLYLKYFKDDISHETYLALAYSSHPQNKELFHWEINCNKPTTLESCTVGLKSTGFALVIKNSHKVTGELKPQSPSLFRILAPNPSESFRQIYKGTNYGKTGQSVKYSTTIGVSQTRETSHTVSRSVSIEIGAAFKAFSASVSSTLSNSWTTTNTKTFESAKTVEHVLTKPPRSTVILKQLVGHYAGEFNVGADVYEIEEIPLDGGPHKTIPL